MAQLSIYTYLWHVVANLQTRLVLTLHRSYTWISSSSLFVAKTETYLSLSLLQYCAIESSTCKSSTRARRGGGGWCDGRQMRARRGYINPPIHAQRLRLGIRLTSDEGKLGVCRVLYDLFPRYEYLVLSRDVYVQLDGVSLTFCYQHYFNFNLNDAGFVLPFM